MKTYKKIFITLFLILGLKGHAEVPHWVVTPQYDDLTQVTESLYKFKNNGKSGLIDQNGKIVISGVDSITPFTEGVALAVTADDNGFYKIRSIIREDRTMKAPDEEMYLSPYPFFSEGLMPVLNKSKKAGYIDTEGNLVIPFKYSNPHPFSNGYAAVSKGKGFMSSTFKKLGMGDLLGKDKVFYINPLGGEMKISKDVGDIYFGSTFKNGEALVINKEKQFNFIDQEGRLRRIEPTVTLTFDYMNRLGDDGIEPDFTFIPSKGTPDVLKIGQISGYADSVKVVVPPQFALALPFSNNRAIVSNGKEYGIIEMADGDIKLVSSVILSEGTNENFDNVDYEITMPEAFTKSIIDLKVLDKEGNIFSKASGTVGETGKVVLNLNIPKDDKTLILSSESLELWNSKLNQEETGKSENMSQALEYTFKSSQAKANSKDVASVVVTVENNSSKEISGEIKMTGAAPYPKTVTVPAGGKVNINANFYHVKKKEVRNMTIDICGNTISKKITLQPFFNF